MISIYIAGPYTGDEERNTRRMIEVYQALIKKGYAPFCPLLSHYAAETSISYKEWMRQDTYWLLKCDAMFFMGSSPGADAERLVAEAKGIPIYEDLQDL